MYGEKVASTIRNATLELYKRAAEYALTRGIIIADTKFEFGLDDDGNVLLMDEVLTPDSSRFWPADSYEVGTSPKSFDKQYIRDWRKRSPGTRPRRLRSSLKKSSKRRPTNYREALRRRLTGTDIEP